MHLHCLHRTSVVLLQPVKQRKGRTKKKKRDETYYSPQEKEITVFESYKEKTNIYSVISSVYGI